MLDLLLQGVSQALNQPLRYQITNHIRYRKLYGKKMLWHLTSPSIDIITIIEPDSVQIIQEQTPQDIHLSITTDIWSLIAIATDSSKPKQTFTLQGDNQLANLLKAYLKNLDIDWQAFLSDLLSPEIAYILLDQIKQNTRWAKKSKKAFIQSSHDYLVHTSELTPSKESLQNFYQQVDSLCQDLDRLERLTQTRKSHDC